MQPHGDIAETRLTLANKATPRKREDGREKRDGGVWVLVTGYEEDELVCSHKHKNNKQAQ